ncbi:Methyl-accepting chemotaxis protein PctC [Pelotomaculum sp. FP]|nr:Methyl-accepting chemotaxis protein PctC [Pelotomaculum sp. FP]
MHFNSLRPKFIFVTCLICLTCLFIVSLVSYLVSYKIVKNEVNQKALESVMKYANQFNSWFVEQGSIVNSIGEDLEINGDFSDAYLLYYLSSKLKRQETYVIDYYMGFPTRDRPFIDGSGWLPPAEFDCTTRKWYKGALKNDGLVYTTPYLDASTKKMIFTISRPVKQDGKLIGIAAADILVTDLMQLAEQSKTEEADYAFLLDDQQNFLVHPENSIQPKPDVLEKADSVMGGLYLPLVEQIRTENYGIVELVDYDGINRFFVLSPIESTNWTFGVAIPKSQYLKAIDKLWLGFATALVVSLGIGVLVILFFINTLLKPIVKLKEAVNRYSQKDFSSRSPVLTSDEVGELSRSFNMMADTIQEYNRTLQQRVEERTRELHEKNVRIMQSIDYAQRIQSSILPDLEETLGTAAKDYFIIWRPRDIVGGDFYWCKRNGSNLYLAVADCTGHGVPGALMTMTASAILDRITDDAEGFGPAYILQRLNKLLRETLRQDNPGALTNDGLDIGLCLIKPAENKLIYSGARLTLFYCRDPEVFEIKGDRQSVGYKESKIDYQFTSTEISLAAVTACYLTTDGLFDQNGGESELGFGSKRFKEIIMQNQAKPLSEQKRILNEVLDEFMGEENQRDDITVLGFKI